MTVKDWIFLVLGIMGAFSLGYVQGVKDATRNLANMLNRITEGLINRETNMTNNESDRSSKGEN